MNILGIDVGGTSIKGAIVNNNGEILTDKFSLPIIKGEGQDATMERLVALIKGFLTEQNIKIEGIGLGIPGSINTKDGSVTYSNNLKWTELKIVNLFAKEFNLPIRITNDANAAALGEALFGAGKEYPNMLMITLGTGVGSGIVIDGKIYEGKEGKGAECGHSSLFADGILCTCGRKGCLEMYASATALIRQTKEAMEKNPSSKLWDGIKDISEVNGKTVFDAAKAGDKVANEVVDKYVYYLSEGLLNICNIFRPEGIVLSGGIANQGDYLLDKINAYLRKYEYGYPMSPATDVKVAVLGYNSGIIGAASLFFKKGE